MTENVKMLSSAEFSKSTGIAVPTVTKMLREGKLRGEKRNGKWAIYASEIQSPAIGTQQMPVRSAKRPDTAADGSAPEATAYDIETFARMTYLTEKGVRLWLKEGRLSGRRGADGKRLVDAANLDRPELRHLIRK
jgi:hypothetical protein